MIKKILGFLITALFFYIPLRAQVLSTGTVTATARFLTCGGGPVGVTATFYAPGSPGSHVDAAGLLVCDNPCDTTTIDILLTNLQWDKNPGNNWIHGMYVPPLSGVQVTQSPTLPTFDPNYAFLNAGCTGGCPSGISAGTGYYFVGPGEACCPGGGSTPAPCDNYGDATKGCGTIFSYPFRIRVCNSIIQGSNIAIVVRADSDGNTGCWNVHDNNVNKLTFRINVGPGCAPLYNTPTATNGPITKVCTPAPQYSVTLNATCGNSRTVEWYDASTGGNLVGTGSPFTYTTSACPAGTTLYAACCPTTAICGSRKAYAITGTCPPTIGISNVLVTQPTCTTPTGSIDGSTITGGVPPYTYTLTPGGSNSTGLFGGLTPGSYTLTVTDASGCSASAGVTINPVTGATFTPSSTTVAASCPGVNNGSITVTVVPAGTYTYTLDGNATTTNGTGVFTNVSGGSHTVTVANATCNTNITVNVGTGAALTSTSSHVNTSCNNATNGTMTATPTNGTAPYTYTINATPTNVTGLNSGTFTGLAAGTYIITFTDANGCQGTATQTVSAGLPLTATIANTGASCPGINNGTVTVTAPNGTAPYSYTINAAPANTTGAATGIFTGLAGGTYTVTFTDANGCTGTATTTVATGAALTSTSSHVNTSCNNATNGTMTATPTNGTAPYTYTINATPTNVTGLNSGTFTGLAAGTFIITFTDANGCQGTTTQTIAAGPALTATIASTGASCPGINNGTVTVTAPTGTAPFSYTINATPANTTGAATGVFTGLAGGTYTVTFTDANGCTGTATTTVTTGAALTSTSSHVNTSCNNAANGTMTATPTNGTAPYTYTINATPTNVTGLNTGTFTGLAAGTFIITFTDANGCQGTTTQTIAAGPALTATITNTGASCPGINNGTVTVTAPTGTAPFSYTINATPANTTGAATGTFINLPGGTYTVTFTDAGGCTGTATTTVATGAAITVTSSTTGTSTTNASDGTMTATGSGGTAPYAYTINATPANTTGATSGTFTGLAAGSYTITVTDANGCTGTTTLTVAPGPGLTATVSTTATSCPAVHNGSVTLTAPTGVGPWTYTISATPTNTTGATSGTFTGLASGSYSITITDANGSSGIVNATVGSGAALTSTSSHVNTSCNNATNGSMTAAPAAGSGTAPFTYTINATPVNTSGATSGTFTNLAPGTFIITFTDANGCQGTATQTVAAGPALAATASTTATACPAVNNGSVTVTAPTGTAPFSYTINATPANTTGAATGTFTGLAGGSYIVTFTDAGGCTGTVSATVATGTPIAATSSFTSTSCNAATDGTMTATPTAGSGTAPFGYTINATPANTTGATSGTFTGLAAGTYTITFTDANGCSGTTTQTITAGSSLSATGATTGTACPSINNGTLTITAPTGTAPFSYTINATPANTTGATSGVFTGLAAGPYTVTFTDANSCSGTVNATVAAGAAITAASTAVNTSCNNASDGSMTATPTAGSGTAPFSYTINATPANTTGATSGTFTGLAPGTYIITFTDANGCTGTTTQTIAAGAPLTATATTTGTACPAVNNGTLTVTAPTGTAPFSYTINATPANTTGATSGVFTGLAAGSYTVTFTSANTCTGTVTATVAAGAAITATSSVVNTSCNNATDGSVTATPTAGSGTAPFSYTINATPANTTGAASGIFTGLAPGAYVITFTDANGCTGTTGQTVAAGPALTATATTTGTACPTVNNGTLTVTAPTGIAPFSYTINATPANTTGAASGIFTGLAAGPYTVTFTAANGCTGTVTATVAQGTAITASSSVVNTSCNNASDGSVTATPTAGSGTAPFSYTINATPANTTGAASGTFTGLAPGAYVITFTDANGCTGTTGQTVAAGPALAATATTVGTSCPAVNNGSLTATPTTGIAPFSYTINATPANTTGAASGIFTGLAAGPYTVTFTAANGCTGTVTATVAQGAAITAASSKTNTSCNNAVDGSMTANPSGGTGTAPFTYTINAAPANTTGASTGTFTGLAAGTYIITFTDANGCAGTVTQTVDAGSALAATPNTTGTACPGIDNGTFTATAPTGIAPFTYTINATLANTTGASTGVFTGLAAGTYIISFTASNGCTGTITGTVAQGAALTSTAASVNPNCANINDGTFTVTPTNGAAPYTYTIDAPGNTTGASTGTFTGLAPGTYIITFTDANGCTGTQPKTLTTNAPITTPETHTDVKCFGGTDGTITLTPAGGVAPYTYATGTFTTFQASSTITGLAAGSHTIRVKDNVGCTKDTTIIIAEPTQLTASAVKDNNATCEGNDGGITVTAAGGTTPYQYSIDNGVTYQAAGVFTNATNTTYSGNIKVKDANGCTATANSVTVGQDNNLVLDILANPDTTICQGSSVKFTPTLTNAGAGATYSWTSLTPVVPNSTIDSLHSLNATVSPVDTAIYKLTVTYKACTISDNVPVNVIWKPIVNAGPSAVSICLGDSTLLIGTVTHTSGPIDSLVWTPTDSLTTPVSNQTWAHPVSNTYYHLTAYTSVGVGKYGCVFTPQAYDSIKVVIPAPVIASAGHDTIAVKGQPHQLLGSGGVSYTWSSLTATISNPLAQNPFVTLYNDANFSVIVKNAIGCADTASVFVKVLDGPAYYIPNAFSPNGDGLNDVFRAIPAGMANTQYFKVMNRYGETVFETNQYLKGWDGTFKGKKQPIGVYVWIVKGQDKDGKTVEMKGTVMLIQ